METEEDTYSTVFSVLKHPVRRRIVRMLRAKPHTYTEILKALNVETGYLNYHLESMRELITKDAQGRYSLSVFGEAAANLITRVEEPDLERKTETKVMGLMLTRTQLLTVALAVLLVSNVYTLLVYRGLYVDRTNALGEIVIQTRGLLSEANHILNHTVIERRIDFDTWAVMLRDLSLQLRLYNTISTLDFDHKHQWVQIRTAVDEVTVLFYQIDQKYGQTGVRYFSLSSSQASSLTSLLEGLVIVESDAFPKRIVWGASPEVRVDEEGLTRAVEAAMSVQTRVQSADKDFFL